MKPRISLITLGVRDLKGMLAFYRDGLGWPTRAGDSDIIAFFQLGGTVFALCDLEELRRDSQQALKIETPGHVLLSQNLASEAEVVQAFQEVEKAGGKIVKRPQKTDWGGFSGYFADPEGNLLEIAYNPEFSFDEHGSVII